MNIWVISGNLGRDPEFQVTANKGTPVCKFSVAVKDWNGSEEVTYWVNVVAWSSLAEICERYLVKGSLVTVSGKAIIRDYVDKEGIKRRAIELNANQIQLPPKTSAKRDSITAEPTYSSVGGPFEPDWELQ